MAESPESTVLEEEVDEDYEPSDEDVIEFASWLGMELPEEHCLLWIAKDGLKAPLPFEWKPCRTEEDEIYYFNFDTGESSWDHPCDNLYRSLYKDEAEKRLHSKQPPGEEQKKRDTGSTGEEQKRDTGSINPSLTFPAPIRVDAFEEMNRVQEPNNRQQQQPGMVVRWRAAVQQLQQDKMVTPAEDQQQVVKETKKNEAVEASIEAETPTSYRSMQAELLEKIKMELQEEGGNLMEQKRKEVIEEVERQIEMERQRLRGLQNAKLQHDLAREQREQEEVEGERKHAWDTKLKDEEEAVLHMKVELESRKKKIEEDMGSLIESETKAFEEESRVRMNVFRKTLCDEEGKLLELGKEATLKNVAEKIQLGESVAMESMKEEAMSRMKHVIRSLEGEMYEREFSLVSDGIRERMERSRIQRQMQVQREVEDEMSRARDELLREKREELMEKLRDRIISEQQDESERLRSYRGSSPNGKRPAESGGSFGLSELANVIQNPVWEALLSAFMRRSWCETKGRLNVCEEERYAELKRSVEELQQAMLGLHEEIASLKRPESQFVG